MIEWTNFFDDQPYAYRVNVVDGCVDRDQLVLAINKRVSRDFPSDMLLGLSPLTPGVPPDYADKKVDTPWELYELYPTGKVEYTLPMIENTGMGNTPGNLANGWSHFAPMAELGDWIFMYTSEDDVISGGGVTSIYKMRSDGSRMVKLYEGKRNARHYIRPAFQLIGDWLYVGSAQEDYGSVDFYKIQAEDFEFTAEGRGNGFYNQVIDQWEYKRMTYDGKPSIVKISLDNAKMEFLCEYDDSYYMPLILSADEDWVYIWWDGESIYKVANDGTGERKAAPGEYGFPRPQIIGGRIYYFDGHFQEEEQAEYRPVVLCLDTSFTQTPETLIPISEGYNLTALHVTDSFIYYGIVGQKTGQGTIMRAGLDGANPIVLADGFDTGHQIGLFGYHVVGSLYQILIAGDWMMFMEFYNTFHGDKTTWYLMRLDGTDLHILGEPYIPPDAPGITDSTGKWRYELLEDGTAMIVGPGSKLKFSGKLDIPKAVDKIPVTAIGENAFYGYDGFTSVTIPKGVTTIGDFAFFFCKGLTGVTIPEGVTHIGEGAFQWCESVKKASLPASLISIGAQAFANCPAAKFTVAKKNEVFAAVNGVLFDKARNLPIE